jgi:hypothetical protein
MPAKGDNVASMVKYQALAGLEQAEMLARLKDFLELEREAKVRSAENMPIPLFQPENRLLKAKRLHIV